MRISLLLFCLFLNFNIFSQSTHWLHTFGSIKSDLPAKVEVDDSDNIIVAGSMEEAATISFNNISLSTAKSNGNGFIFKQDNANNLIWYKQLGGSKGKIFIEDLESDPLGNIYITGSFEDTVDFDPSNLVSQLVSNNSSKDIFLAKYNSSGHLIWAKGFGGNNWDGAMNVLVEGISNVYISGYFSSAVDFDPSQNTTIISGVAALEGFVSKFSAAGDFKFVYPIVGGGYDKVSQILFNNNHDIIAIGSFQLNADMNPLNPAAKRFNSGGGTNLFILRIDTAGLFISAKKIGGSAGVDVSSAFIDSQDTLYIGGIFGFVGSSSLVGGTIDFNPNSGSLNYSSYGGEDSYILKLDPNDNPIWFNHIDGNGKVRILELKQTLNQDLLFSCYFKDSTSLYSNGTLMNSFTSQKTSPFNVRSTGSIIGKVDRNGKYKWLYQFNSVASAASISIDHDSQGNYYFVGYFQGQTDFDPSSATNFLTPVGQNDIFVMKNFNGLTTAIETDFDKRESSFKVYPNPTSGDLKVQLANMQPFVEVLIRDLNGKLVLRSQYRDIEAFELELNGKNGLYFIELKSDNFSYHTKVIKH